MKKQMFSAFFITVLCVSMLSLSGCGLFNKEKDTSRGTSTENEITQMFGNKTQVCTATMDTGGKTTIYIDKDKTRVEVTDMMVDGKDSSFVMINDGEWMYNWSETKGEEAVGTKISLADLEQMEEDMAEFDDMYENDYMEYDEDTDYENDPNYTCKKWKADKKMFIAPSDVDFMDQSQMLQGMNDMVEDVDMESFNEGLKGLCDFAPEEAKADCLADLE